MLPCQCQHLLVLDSGCLCLLTANSQVQIAHLERDVSAGHGCCTTFCYYWLLTSETCSRAEGSLGTQCLGVVKVSRTRGSQ